jgi:nitrogen regulatory protein PII
MKMITAIIQPYRLDHVCAALSEVGILGVSVTECCGYGRQRGQRKIHSGEAYGNNLVAKIMLQLVVPADKITTITEAIIRGARTGQIRDGKIFITPIEKVIRQFELGPVSETNKL